MLLVAASIRFASLEAPFEAPFGDKLSNDRAKAAIVVSILWRCFPGRNPSPLSTPVDPDRPTGGGALSRPSDSAKGVPPGLILPAVSSGYHQTDGSRVVSIPPFDSGTTEVTLDQPYLITFIYEIFLFAD